MWQERADRDWHGAAYCSVLAVTGPDPASRFQSQILSIQECKLNFNSVNMSIFWCTLSSTQLALVVVWWCSSVAHEHR